jgi:hypothetical protein
VLIGVAGASVRITVRWAIEARRSHVYTTAHHISQLHQKAHKKLAGEAGVLAPYLGAQLGIDEIGGLRAGCFSPAAHVSGRIFRYRRIGRSV